MDPELLAAYRRAISNIESKGSGGYAAIGPTHPKYGRALGAYQVMESNLPGWSRDALGREVSADQFLGSPELQDAIFNHRFGGYVQKYGPSDAASMWFTGRPQAEGANASDVLGTTGSAYVAKFNARIGGSGGGSPAKAAPSPALAVADAQAPAEAEKAEDDPTAVMRGLLAVQNASPATGASQPKGLLAMPAPMQFPARRKPPPSMGILARLQRGFG